MHTSSPFKLPVITYRTHPRKDIPVSVFSLILTSRCTVPIFHGRKLPDKSDRVLLSAPLPVCATSCWISGLSPKPISRGTGKHAIPTSICWNSYITNRRILPFGHGSINFGIHGRSCQSIPNRRRRAVRLLPVQKR